MSIGDIPFGEGKTNHGTTDKGYFVNLPDVDPGKSPSGYLQNTKKARFPLWIREFTASFQLGGTTAQSLKQRRFFARNFIAPSFTIVCQFANSAQYNRLAEFVYDANRYILDDPSTPGEYKGAAMKLVIPASSKGANRAGHGIKGPRQGYEMDGHILSIARGAERFVNAPQASFEFLMATSAMGLFKTSPARARALMSWADIIAHQDKAAFIDDPDAFNDSPTFGTVLSDLGTLAKGIANPSTTDQVTNLGSIL